MVNRRCPLLNQKALEKFGKKIRTFRLKKGISQENLAHAALIERSYMGAIERGERNPSFDKIISIAKALDIPTGKLTDI